ncbi:MAG: Rrf2 family transcriptional regulator [Gammaproteobacteria bacterium]|nr:MAG: Rrf2 family transcriptional regulator [Gammaproteobacteria bacterium]
MQLTRHTDFSLRVLIFLSLQDNNSLVTIDDVAAHFNVLKNHLTKVVHQLAKHGYVKTVRGKHGGICLAQLPASICLSEIIQAMEANIEVINCREPACPLVDHCELKGILNEAQHAFFTTLEKYTLADIARQPQEIKTLLNWS